MKLLLRGILLILTMTMLFACGDSNEAKVSLDDLSMSLTSTVGDDVEVFSPSRDGKELYLYFTGVS